MFFADPERIGVLLIKSIYEAHLRTCVLTTEQIHEQWLVGVDQSMLFGFKNMVSTYSNLLQKSTKKIGEITFFTKQNLQFDETMHDALFASERLKSTFFKKNSMEVAPKRPAE